LYGNFNRFFIKGYKCWLKNLWIYESIPIELFVDIENLMKMIKVAHITMLENIGPLNVYFKINLRGESVDLGQ
jgi:hypothetical protein